MNFPAAAQVILASAMTSARKVLITHVYGCGTHTTAGDAMLQTAIFSSLYDLPRDVKSTEQGPDPEREVARRAGADAMTVAFEELARIWDGVLDGTPGSTAFGYVLNTDARIADCSITFYGMHGGVSVHALHTETRSRRRPPMSTIRAF